MRLRSQRYKQLRFLSSCSIKDKKQEIPESHWLFTTTTQLQCLIQISPLTPPHDDLRPVNTSQHFSYTKGQVRRVWILATAAREQPSSGIRYRRLQVERLKRKEGCLMEIWHQINVRSLCSDFKCVWNIWGPLKAWNKISELDCCPTPTFSSRAREQALTQMLKSNTSEGESLWWKFRHSLKVYGEAKQFANAWMDPNLKLLLCPKSKLDSLDLPLCLQISNTSLLLLLLLRSLGYLYT